MALLDEPHFVLDENFVIKYQRTGAEFILTTTDWGSWLSMSSFPWPLGQDHGQDSGLVCAAEVSGWGCDSICDSESKTGLRRPNTVTVRLLAMKCPDELRKSKTRASHKIET